jgi:hypothetical protein
VSALGSQRALAQHLRSASPRAPAGLQAPAGIDLAQRWAVHRNTFLSSLIAAHEAAFPVTLALVGSDCFRALARARVLADPPRAPVLAEYVQDLPDFIATYAPTRSLPYLADVAAIEALCIAAHHAADAIALPAADYQQLRAAPERLVRHVPCLHPAARWLRSRHAVFSLWQAHQGVGDLAEVNLMYLDPDSPEDVLVTRPEFAVGVIRLPAGGIALLDALQRGQCLGAAFADALAADPHADAARLFGLLLDHQLLVQPPLPAA